MVTCGTGMGSCTKINYYNIHHFIIMLFEKIVFNCIMTTVVVYSVLLLSSTIMKTEKHIVT